MPIFIRSIRRLGLAVIVTSSRGQIVISRTYANTRRPFGRCTRIIYTRQSRANNERIIADACDTIRYCYTRQSRATVERTITDARDAIGNSYTRQSRAILERRRADARDAIRYCDTRQSCATIERRRADARDAIRYRYARQVLAIIERSRADACDASVGRNNTVLTTYHQSLAFCFNNTIARRMIYRISFCNSYARQTCTTLERPIADARDTITYCYTRQSRAIIERPNCNGCRSFFNRISARNCSICLN